MIAPDRPVVPPVLMEPVAAHDPDCPFCAGNEERTPPDLLRIPQQGGEWEVRVVPDKFAVLQPEIPPVKRDGFFRALGGFGHHEIVIEHPDHSLDLSDLPAAHVFKVLKAYRARQRELARDKRVKFVTIFKQHGLLAGANFSHPHSQILASPVVPEYMHRRQEIAKSFAGATQHNLYSEILEAERGGKRLIEDDDRMTAFVPFAAAVPYQMWIMPRDPQPTFSAANDHDLEALAETLQRCLSRLRNCCGDVAYSYVIYSASVGEEGPYYQWHVEIVPRLTRPSGAELGPHICVNPMLPEECARQLREARDTKPAPHAVLTL